MIKWIKKLFKKEEWTYYVIHSDTLWRAKWSSFTLELSDDSPDDWTSTRSPWSMKDKAHLDKFEITKKQAKERFPNATI